MEKSTTLRWPRLPTHQRSSSRLETKHIGRLPKCGDISCRSTEWELKTTSSTSVVIRCCSLKYRLDCRRYLLGRYLSSTFSSTRQSAPWLLICVARNRRSRHSLRTRWPYKFA